MLSVYLLLKCSLFEKHLLLVIYNFMPIEVSVSVSRMLDFRSDLYPLSLHADVPGIREQVGEDHGAPETQPWDHNRAVVPVD